MRFFVTYAVMDGALANPFWHAFLLLSYWPGHGHKIQALNAWGFYAAATTTPDSMYRKLKQAIHLDIDLQNNHGLLKIEELRYLDVGYGLRGVTFDISFEQFCQLKANCRNLIAGQAQATKEAIERLSTGTYTPNSKEIFQEEMRRAKLESRPSRLKPFEFRLCLDSAGLTLNNSHSCKSLALDLLRDIGIEQKYLDDLTQQNSSKAIPRNSGYLEPIFLHSTGPAREHISERTGKITLFRTWQDKQAKLFWTLPPQLLMNANPKLETLFYLPDIYEEKVKSVIKRLQALQKIVENVAPTDATKEFVQRLVAHINKLYDVFAVILSSNRKAVISKKITEVESFFDDIHSAIIDDWDDEKEPAFIVAKFAESEQRAICKLIERPYMRWSAASNARNY